jgi:hypothetical protein
MIDIRWERERTPIHIMGQINPLTFTRGAQELITLEVNDDDGEGVIHFRNMTQLARLAHRLNEVLYPQALQDIRPGLVDEVVPTVNTGQWRAEYAGNWNIVPDFQREPTGHSTADLSERPEEQESMLDFIRGE